MHLNNNILPASYKFINASKASPRDLETWGIIKLDTWGIVLLGKDTSPSLPQVGTRQVWESPGPYFKTLINHYC